MFFRMTDVATPPTAENTTSQQVPPAPSVKVIVTHVEGADLHAALATIARQVYEAVESVEIVGPPDMEVEEGVTRYETMEDAISETGTEIDYLWLIHSDARPRPDALAALVGELDRSEASMGGSKILVAGTRGELESIGSATDIFGEPYSGLDEGEVDLQQYDVVREVAFISSVSMLVRRDLMQGLSGVDPQMKPGAAGLDLSQRVRLAGGRVLIVPSSEVYHQGRCGVQRGWREQAGRQRAMLKAYRLLTLAWVIPFGLIVALIDSVASLLLLRWRPLARHGAAIGWNLIHLPSTVAARRRFRRVRAVGDEELFRFQASGSVRLREVGSDFSDQVLFMFDEDHALIRGTRRVWASPGIWGAVLAAVVAVFATRSIFLGGTPIAGYSFPFEAPGTALDRFLGGWNDSGLGSPNSVHPSTGLTGLASLLWFGAEDATRNLLTLGFAALAVVGMGRLAGRLGFRGPGRYLSGLVLLAGPGTALAAGVGSWLALGGAAVLPWSVRSVFLHDSDRGKSYWTHVGWAILWALALAAFSPVLVVVPILSLLIWKLSGGTEGRLILGAASILGLAVAAGFLLADPGWLLDGDRRVGLSIDGFWPILIVLAAAPMILVPGRTRRLASLGAVLALVGVLLSSVSVVGPGIEEAALVIASFGSAIVVAAAFDLLSRNPLRLIAAATAVYIVVLSVGSLADGRLGLLEGDTNASLGFASTLAGEGGAGRILVVSENRSEIPGEARPGPGFWYRTLDGEGTTLDEVWLPPPAPGDDELRAAIGRIATGAELRPGELLADFSIEWVVVAEGPGDFEEILAAQLDLIPTPLVPGSSVYENPAAMPLAHEDVEVWRRDGAGFVGEPSSGRTTISANFDPGWSPESGEAGWATSVSAEAGVARFRSTGPSRVLPLAAIGVLLAALVSLAVGRFRR